MSQEITENQVFDLLETKDFQELNSDERTLVLSVLTQSDYELQRTIILAAANSESEMAPPLVLPAEKRKVLPIWLASACSAAAAAILVFLMMPSSDTLEIEMASITIPTVKDTLIVQNTVTDTVIDYHYIKVKEEADDCCPTNADLVQIPNFSNGGANIPVRENDLVNRGVSAANDADLDAFRSQPFIGM